jgi:hypothetical protein
MQQKDNQAEEEHVLTKRDWPSPSAIDFWCVVSSVKNEPKVHFGCCCFANSVAGSVMANTREAAAIWQSVKDKTANLVVWIERVTAAATEIMERAAEAERFLEKHEVLSRQLRVQVQEMAARSFFRHLRHTTVMAVHRLRQCVMIYAGDLWQLTKDESNYTLEAISREAGRLHEQAKEHCCADIAALTKALETLHFHGFKAMFPVKSPAPVTWWDFIAIGVPVLCAAASAKKAEYDASGTIVVVGVSFAVAALIPNLVAEIAFACECRYDKYCQRRVRQDVMRMEHIAGDIEALIGSLAVISEAAVVDTKSDAPSQAGELSDVVQQWSTEDEMTMRVMEEIRVTVKMLETFVRRPIVFAKDLEAAGVSFRVHLVSTAAGEDPPTTVAWAGLSRRTRTFLQCNPKSCCCTA